MIRFGPRHDDSLTRKTQAVLILFFVFDKMWVQTVPFHLLTWRGQMKLFHKNVIRKERVLCEMKLNSVPRFDILKLLHFNLKYMK